MFRTGPRNLITDVAGLRVGNASDVRLKSGVTTIVCDEPAVAAGRTDRRSLVGVCHARATRCATPDTLGREDRGRR